MYVGRDFSDMDVGENEVFTLDFANELTTGETIVSTVWTCSVVTGRDATAQARRIGSAASIGTKSLQRIADLKGGTRYLLRADVVTNLGNTRSLWSHVNCTIPV